MISRVKRYFLEIKNFSKPVELNLPKNYQIILDEKKIEEANQNTNILEYMSAVGEFLPFKNSTIDAIILNTEFQQTNRVHSRNAFDALGSIFGFISDRIEYQNLKIGSLVANEKKVKLRLFYTPRILTTNSLVFKKENMDLWWKEGWEYAQKKIIEEG